MSRRKKEPTVDVTALEHIPAVKAALSAVGLEMVIRPMSAIYPKGSAPKVDLDSAPGHIQPIILNTPERLEWQQQQADVQEAIAAETSGQIARPPGPLPMAQRKAIQQGLLLDAASRKAELMAKFKHDAPSEGDTNGVVVETEALTALSEAT